MKVLHGLAFGLWIVGPKWINESEKNGSWVQEDDFEMSGDLKLKNIGLGGPARARVATAAARTDNSPRLLRGTKIYFCGEYIKNSKQFPEKEDLLS
eukprot:CAMPEP_0184008700 /NCGR_PEP_ID=MMETSP0954-20121128/2134_1 /TAXON_ID=627963 /ORGANISM="Aplanochytrium sp, Strain PBS07" /LENGTH=95 /DNA_ID=CAMNT_0026287869 /DNA_START=472 /DNA_END=755 /DNA_ORIENTATION=-